MIALSLTTMLFAALIVKSPLIVDVPSAIESTSVSETFAPDTTETALLKSFVALASVIALVPAVKVVVPVTEREPAKGTLVLRGDCETAPLETRVKSPPILTLSHVVANAFFSETLPPDFTEIAPPKLFATLASVISFASAVAPAVKVVVPSIEITPVCCKTSPVEIRAKLPLRSTTFNVVANALVSETS